MSKEIEKMKKRNGERTLVERIIIGNDVTESSSDLVERILITCFLLIP